MEPDRHLGWEQWHRQLLQRERDVTVEGAVQLAAGIYSTAPTSYLSFVARVRGFVRADLDRALYTDRTLARISTLRGSGFLVPLDKLALVTAGSDRGDWYLGAAEKLIGKREVERLTDAIYEVLDGKMASAREMTREFGLAGEAAEAFRFLLKSLAVRLHLSAAGSPGSWRSNQYKYALWHQWFGSEPDLDIDSHRARIELAEWYLQGHGPATPEDFAWWGGLKKANARRALATSPAVEVDGWYDLPHQEPAPEPTGVRLLPIWDTALVRQEKWRRMVPPAEFDRVYDASGNLTSTVVRDGVVVGVWDREVEEKRLLVKVAGFGRLAKATRGGIEAEAQLIGSSLGLEDVEVEYHQDPVDLRQASRNRFMSPLSG